MLTDLDGKRRVGREVAAPPSEEERRGERTDSQRVRQTDEERGQERERAGRRIRIGQAGSGPRQAEGMGSQMEDHNQMDR